MQDGDLKARVAIRHSGDQLDELGLGLNGMLDRLDSICFAAPVFFHVVRYFWV